MTFPLFELTTTIVWPLDPLHPLLSLLTFCTVQARIDWAVVVGGATQRFATPRQDGSANYTQIAVLPTAREEKIERNTQIQNRNLHRMNAEKWKNKKTNRPTRALHHCPFPHCVALSWAKMSEIIKENREREKERDKTNKGPNNSHLRASPLLITEGSTNCVFFFASLQVEGR